ncbi:MAG: SLC13 family permease, partial [Nannocystaceae bacterium]
MTANPLSMPSVSPLLASGAGHAVDTGTTLLFAAVLVGLILCLALEEKIHAKKSFIAGAFAVVSLMLAMIFEVEPGTAEVHVLEETLTIPIYIPAIDWGVIAIILGSSLFVDVTSKSGLFTWIAIRLTKASGGDPVKLLWFYGLMTVVFSAVLNNVTAMIIVGSLTGVSLRKLDRESQLLGFLLIEGLLTNIGGLLTLI